MPNSNHSSPSGKKRHGFMIRQEGPVAVITMRSTSEPGKLQDLEAVFEELLQNNCIHHILDLSETRLIHSHEIGAIVRHLQVLQEKNGRFIMVNPSDRVRYLLEMTRITQLASIVDDLDTALNNITSPTG